MALIVPALAVALSQPAAAKPESCMGGADGVLAGGGPAGGEYCMGGDPVDARNGTCAIHSAIACRD